MIYFFYCMMLLSSPNAKPNIPYYVPVVRARGLDSTFNVKEKIWYYYNWSNGKRTNLRRTK